MKKFIALLMCVNLTILSPFSSVAAESVSGSDVSYDVTESGGTWVIGTEKYSSWTLGNDTPNLVSGTSTRFQVDDKAVVRKNEDGTYRVRIGFASYSIFEMMQVTDPAKTGDILQYCQDNSISATNFPLGTFNLPESAEDCLIPANYETIKAKTDESVNQYYLTDGAVRIECIDEEMDWGIIEFNMDSLSEYIFIKPCTTTRTDLAPIIIGLDNSSMQEVPDTLTYEPGTYTMGFEWTNHAYEMVKVGRRNNSITTLNFLNEIFENNVLVTVAEDGTLEAEFTVNMEVFNSDRGTNQVTSVGFAESRDMSVEGNQTDTLYALLVHEIVGTEFAEIQISETGTVTIPFEDIMDGKLVRISTVESDAYNDGRTNTNQYKYYWGRLYLNKDNVEVYEVTITADNGAVLKTDSNTFKEGYKFVCVDNWDETDQASVEAVRAYAESDESYHLYTYWIEDADGNRVVPQSSVTIDLPVPSHFNIDTTFYCYSKLSVMDRGYGLPSGISEVVENEAENWVLRLTPTNLSQYDYEITMYDAGTDMTAAELSSLEWGKYYRVRPTMANSSASNRPSMSSGIIEDNTGILHVTEEGEYELYVTLQGLLVEPDYGFLTKMNSVIANGLYPTEVLSYKSTADLRDVEWDKYQELGYDRDRDDEDLNIDYLTDEYNIHYIQSVKIPLLYMDRRDHWQVSFVVPLMNDKTHADITTATKLADIRLVSGVVEEVDPDELPGYNTTVLLAAIQDAGWYLETMEDDTAKEALETAIAAAKEVYEILKVDFDEDVLLEAVAALNEALEGAGGGNNWQLSDGSYMVPYKIYDAGVETEEESTRSAYFDGEAKLLLEGSNMTLTLTTQEYEGDRITLLRYDNGLRLQGADEVTDENDEVIGYTFTRPYTEDLFELEIYTSRYDYQNSLNLKLDVMAAEKITASEEEIEALLALIEELQKLDSTLYTQSSMAVVTTAISNAQTIINASDYLEYDTVQKQIPILMEARDNLVLIADLKGMLENVLELANEYKDDTDVYTTESLELLNAAILQAQQVYDNYETATETDIEAAIEALEAAVEGLESIRYAALKEMVELYQEYQSADYTSASWLGFKTALTNAKALLEETQPSEEELQAAFDELEQTAGELVLASKEALGDLLAGQEKLKESDYTAESWINYQEVLEAVQAVYDNSDSVKDDYEAAISQLEQAVEALEEVRADAELVAALESLKDELEDKLESEVQYEATSYASYRASVKAAEDAIENANSYKLTNEQLEAQMDALQAEFDALILISDLNQDSSSTTASRSFSRVSYTAVEAENETEETQEIETDEILIENDLIDEEDEEETESSAKKETEEETKEETKEETEPAEENGAEATAGGLATARTFSSRGTGTNTASASNATATSRTTASKSVSYEVDWEGDGIYCVNFALWQFAANKESMGNPALCDAYPEKDGKQIKLKLEDGKVYLYVELQAMEFGGDTGHLLEMYMLDNLVTDEEGIVIESYDELYPEVLEYTDETDNYGPPAGSKYPKLLKFEITEFAATKNQYIPVMVNVPVMGLSAEQPAYIRCYWSTLALVEGSSEEDPDDAIETVTLDTEALEAAISKVSAEKKADYMEAGYDALTHSILAAIAVKSTDFGSSQEMVDNRTEALLATYRALIPTDEDNSGDTENDVDKTDLWDAWYYAFTTYKESDYTSASWSAFKTALDKALEVYTRAGASENEVLVALLNLEKAIEGLEKAGVDKTALKALIDVAASLESSDYTTASWMKVATSLALARNVLSSENADQSEVNEKAKDLKAAIEGLEPADSSSGSGSTDGSSSGSGSSGSSSSSSDEENGYYSVKVRLWHSSLNKASMGDDAVVNKAYVKIKDGDATMRLVTKKMTVSGVTAHLHDFWIYLNGSYQEADLISTESSRWIYEFDLPNTTATYYKCQVDPRVDVMGDDPVSARLKVDWDSLSSIDEDDWDDLSGDVDDDDDDDTTTSVVSNYTTELTDVQTGVRVQGNTGGPSVKLSVSEVIEGIDFDYVASALSELADQFVLYNINLLDNGQVVQPTGVVTLKIPVPEGFDTSRLALYRFNDDGTMEQIFGQLNGNYYEASVDHFSLYALAEINHAVAAANTGSSISASGSTGTLGRSGTSSFGVRGTGGVTGLSSTVPIQVVGGRVIPYTGDYTPVEMWFGLGAAAVMLWLVLALTDEWGRRIQALVPGSSGKRKEFLS
ncbi:MAG: hypothetical protein ACRDBO_12365 [Lachnospiraceae bacterium]